MALKSNFSNMVLTLLVVTAISGMVLGFVHGVTKEPIKISEEKAQTEAIKACLPEFKKVDDSDTIYVDANKKNKLIVFTARDENDEVVGTAIKTYSLNGFTGEINLMVGFNPQGTITGYQVLSHKETPGLGSKMQEWFRPAEKKSSLITKLGILCGLVKEDQQANQEATEGGAVKNLIGVSPENVNLTVTKDGGDVDAITASTISSRAFLEAIVRAYNAYKSDVITSSVSDLVQQSKEGGAE